MWRGLARVWDVGRSGGGLEEGAEGAGEGGRTIKPLSVKPKPRKGIIPAMNT